MMATLRRLALAFALLAVLLAGTPAKAQECPWPMMNYYGFTGVLYIPPLIFTPPVTVCWNVPGTSPFHKFSDWVPIPGITKGPPGFSLSENAAYNNAWQYWMSLTVVNSALVATNNGARATVMKDAGPLTGKSVTSFNFWQWVRLGQSALQTYSKVRGVYLALKSGKLNIDPWKLIPKIAIDNSDDPTAPMLMMSVVPPNQGVMAQIKDLTNFTDIRYRGKTFGSRLSTIVSGMGLSFGTRPGINYLTQQLMGPGDENNGWAQVYAMQRSFHSTMTALSMIKRRAAGMPAAGDADMLRRRGSSSFYEDGMKSLGNQYTNRPSGNEFSDTAVSEIKKGMQYLTGDQAKAAQWALQAADTYKTVIKKEQAFMNDRIQSNFAERYKASQGGAAINSIVAPLETETYVKSVKAVEDIIKQVASQNLPGLSFPGAEQSLGLGLETADAWVNRMIRDEVRAMRQIYGLQVKTEMAEALGPKVAEVGNKLRAANKRLEGLQDQVTRLERAKAAVTTVYGSNSASTLFH
jgi:hypothetical protein